MNIEWAIVKVKIYSSESDAVVVRVEEDRIWKHTWVRVGNLIDVTLRNIHGPEMVGIGAKKYEDVVRDAVRAFERELDLRKFEQEENIFTPQVIRGGKK